MKKYIQAVTAEINGIAKSGKPLIIAVDGQCCGGKSTFADMLSAHIDCNIFHTDDFFLTPKLRTNERLCEIGGNFDYERFLSEVLKPLSENTPIKYIRYNCKTQGFESPITVTPKKINIIEGAYSMHPQLINYYDLKILMSIDGNLQKSRVLERNGKAMYERFVCEWIPKENSYIEHFCIKDKADILIHTTNNTEVHYDKKT